MGNEKALIRKVYITLVHLLAITGICAVIWTLNYFNGWKKAGRIYSKNIVKIRKGMKAGEARTIMGEVDLGEKYHAKMTYQRKVSFSDTTVIIVLSYPDGDHTDGSPSLFVNPQTDQVEAIQLGVSF